MSLAPGLTLGGRVALRSTPSLLLLSALLLWAAAFASADPLRQLAQEEYCEGQYPAHRAGFDMGCPDTPIPAHVVGGAPDNPAESCYHIWRAWPPAANGPYYVRNATNPTEVVKMDCDMSHENGPQPEEHLAHGETSCGEVVATYDCSQAFLSLGPTLGFDYSDTNTVKYVVKCAENCYGGAAWGTEHYTHVSTRVFFLPPILPRPPFSSTGSCFSAALKTLDPVFRLTSLDPSAFRATETLRTGLDRLPGGLSLARP